MDDLTKRIGELYAAGKVEEAQKLVDELAEVRMKDELSKKEAELREKYREYKKNIQRLCFNCGYSFRGTV